MSTARQFLDRDKQQAWLAPADELNEETFSALARGEIPAIHVAGFSDPEECRAMCAALVNDQVRARDASTSPMRIVGSNFSNFRGRGKDDYFATVEPAYQDLQTLISQSFDPLQRLLQQLSASWPHPVGIAQETGYGRYFAGGIKSRLNGSALHFDYVPNMTSDFAISRIVEQLSWNLYLQVPQAGGETTLYNAPVRAQPAMLSVQGADWPNTLPGGWTEHCESYCFQPRVGEVVLFNTRYPHSINGVVVADNSSEDQPAVRRIQIGSFIGFMPDGGLVLWS